MTERVCSSLGNQAYARPCREKYCSTQQRRRRAQVHSALFRPRRALWDGKATSKLRCQADDSDEKKLDLLRQEETSDGAILFVFGDAEESAEAKAKGEVETEKSVESSPEPEVAPKQAKDIAEKSPPKSEAAAKEVKKKEKAAPKSNVTPKEGKKADKKAPEAKAAPEQIKKKAESAPEPKAGSEESHDDASEPEAHVQNAEEPTSHLSNNLSETLSHMTVVELKKKCKDVGMKGYSRLKKGELIDALQDVIEQGPSKTAVL